MKPLQRKMRNTSKSVTILVLVDSVLQYNSEQAIKQSKSSHNPCFSGQCFAMSLIQESPLVRLLFVTILVLVDSVLQYCMNFDLRFFAKVTILVLVDSVLQYKRKSYEFERQIEVTILVLVDSVLQ